MRTTEELGVFWLPENENAKFPGTIAADVDGKIVLAADERFSPNRELGRAEVPDCPPLICGRIGLEHIKLVDCYLSTNSTEITAAGLYSRRITWSCHYAFRGDYYEGGTPCRIKSAEFWIEGLDEWAPNLDGIDFRDRSEPASVEFHTDLSGEKAVWDLGLVSLNYRVTCSWQRGRHHLRSIQLASESTVSMEFDEYQAVDMTLDAAISLQVLLTIAKGRPAEVRRVSLVESGNPEAKVTAHIPWNLRSIRPATEDSELFTFQELGGIVGIAKWLDAVRGQTAFKQLLVVDRYHQPTFITDRTNHLFIACEIYMRDQWRIERLHRVQAGPSDFLPPMIAKAGQPFSDRVGDADRWMRKAAKIRNNQGVAHYQGYGTARADQYEEAPFNEDLYLLIILCLLRDCDLSDDLLYKVVERMGSDGRVHL